MYVFLQTCQMFYFYPISQICQCEKLLILSFFLKIRNREKNAMILNDCNLICQLKLLSGEAW